MNDDIKLIDEEKEQRIQDKFDRDIEIVATSTDAEEINGALSRHEGDRDFMSEASSILDNRDDVISLNEAVQLLDEKNMDKIEESFPDVKLNNENVEVAFYTLSDVTEIKSNSDSEYGVGEFYIKDDVESINAGSAQDLLVEYVDEKAFDREWDTSDLPINEIATEFQSAMDYNDITTASVDGDPYVEGANETNDYIFLQTQNSNDTITVIPVDNFENASSDLTDSQLKAVAEMTENPDVLDSISKIEDLNDEVKQAIIENPNTSEETIENMDKAAMLQNDFQALNVNDQIDIKTDGQFNNDNDKQTDSGSMRM